MKTSRKSRKAENSSFQPFWLRTPKAVAAMSGGVDSSVAAALLRRDDFDVYGVFIRMRQDSGTESRQAEERARKTAKRLKIPFSVVDLRDKFKRQIVSYFLREYKAGRTPNPCVLCNKRIKFKAILDKAKEIDADFIATGHYARTMIVVGGDDKGETRMQTIQLFDGCDKTKDQSYFLWKLGQKELRKVLFPIGGLPKKEVRQMAKKFRLPAAKTKESQEVCFIKKTTNDFLKKHLKEKPGDIVDKKGNKLGKHNGLWFYTIGQRKNIGLSGGPYYVIGKNVKNNVLTVSKNSNDLLGKELTASQANWVSGFWPAKLPFRVKAKIRYGAKASTAEITKKTGKHSCKVVFEKPQKAITPGQSIVFYNPLGEQLLGGGIIE